MKARPYFKHSRYAPVYDAHHPHPRAGGGAGPWMVPDLCAAYQWPKQLVGGGVIAIVELGGGWRNADMIAFFSHLGQPMPTIIDISVDGTKNTPGQDADGEVVLDIQIAAAAYFVATGKPATIRVYWASDIAPAVRAATKDGCDVCTISWGLDEADWGKAAGDAMEAAALEATQSGMIVLAASGDNDSSDGGSAPANVDLPAGCPHVIGCGGTTKTRATETVWNDSPGSSTGGGTGGGFSTLFPMPSWQVGLATTPPKGAGRMVPDVAANADPATGYQVFLDGAWQVFGGTSAVAPLYAGLFAAFGKKFGFVSSRLWLSPSAFSDITQGDNGLYHAGVGADPCTGLGAPHGLDLFGAINGTLPAPVPTPTPDPTPEPTVTLAQATKWAQSMIPASSSTPPKKIKGLIASGLRKNWPAGA